MSLTAWIGFVVAAALAVAASAWIYRQREAPGRGRPVLMVLRAAGLALLLLLLFDPDLPTGRAVGGSDARVLIDASLSMRLPADGTTRLGRAVREAAREEAARSGIVVFGDEPRTVARDSIATVEPDETRSRLLPALQAVSEAGLRRAILYTDGGIEDAEEVRRWLPRLGVELTVHRVGDAPDNRAITELTAPAWAETGKPIELRAGIAAVGRSGDSVLVSVIEAGEVRAQSLVAVPAEGRVSTATLQFEARASPDGSPVRYDVVLQGGDAVSDDDTRSVYVHVSDEPAGVAFVSFRPDWEPRFLQPVLERALGLPVRGFLRAGSGTWVRSGAGLLAGERATEQDVRDAVASADLVVLHAYGEAAPSWAHEVVPAARRLLVLPAPQTGATPLPIAVGPAVAADWYLSESVPASPVAHHLAGLDTRDLPPLPALRLTDEEAGGWAPIRASRGRRGSGYPVAFGGETARRRWVIALGDGYWRWAIRGGNARDVYERLWSAIAGWLVEDQTVVAAPEAVQPVRLVVPRGSAARWVLAGARPDSFQLRLTGENGMVALDTVLPVRSDTLVAPVMPPDHYTWDMRMWDAAGEGAARGRITVESFSAEFTRPAVSASTLEAPVVSQAGATRGPRVPLRTTPWPWALLLTILCVEWVLRRRWGFR